MMTMLKRVFALLTALALCLALAACNNTGETESGAPSEIPSDGVSSDAPDPDSDPSADIDVDLTQAMYEFSSGLKDSDTAVTVNGTPISNQEFFYWLSYCCYNISYNAYFSGFSVDFSNDEIRQEMIDRARDAVAYHAVLRELCQKEGITVTAEQQAELQSQIDETGLENILQNYGLTEENFRYVAESSYLFTNYADHLLGEPTDADLEQYVADYGIFSVKHILLKTVDDSNEPLEDSVIAEKKAQADSLLAQLQAADDLETTFDELMNENSEDTGLAYYPDGYTFSQDDSLVDGFREAVLELEPGQISGVVETAYGYHIMLRLPVDASAYHDDYLTNGAAAAVRAEMDKAEIVLSNDISNLDVTSFYNRYMAYGDALYNSLNPVESTEPDALPSSEVTPEETPVE